jgi:signal transduction histidine kinase/ActR/RegA family two-component response regulator
MTHPLETKAWRGREPDGSQAAVLAERVAALETELHRVRLEHAETLQRLHAITRSNELDREMRRAALNLMEDAVAARTAERRENEERRRIEQELRDANRRKDEFLATLAHELRGPLAPIRVSLFTLSLKETDSETVRGVHQMIERQVEHMSRLVDDLMEVSRITRGRIELRKKHVDLASIIRSAIETSSPLIQAAKHTLEVSLPEEALGVEVDPVRLAQVVSNLLNNAAKYTEENGRIWLSASREGDEAVITVRDNGMGIPADMLPKIFDLFTQVDRTYNRAQGGLGIGLTLVRNLVEMHGGSVNATSPGVGQGSEFMVRLPMTPTQQVSVCEIRPLHVSSFQRRVLVVDDNHDSADMMSLLLSTLGAEVHTTHSGAEALESLRTFQPTVVMMDIGMPSMDGCEVARRIRQLPAGRDATLIAISGWGQLEDRRRSQEAGFDHHLVKPVEPQELANVLAREGSTTETW